jgi:predicted DNA-binding protein (MmcQ/YjbR family)
VPSLAALEAKLAKACLAYPGAVEEFPWGDRVFKVNKKIFAFVQIREKNLHVTVKLPASGTMALGLPFVKSTGYGLGKAGWVSATFTRAADVPTPMMLEWIEESYRAIAPKKLLKQLDGDD